jgi:heparin/heparan-sulfate lyase
MSMLLASALLHWPALAAEPPPNPAPGGPLTLEAEAARLNPERVEIVAQDTFPSRKGVSLKDGLASNVGAPETQPDLVFNVKAPQPGRYWLRTHAATDAKGAEVMRQAASKTASLRLLLSIVGSRPSKRVVFVPWSPSGSCTQTLGKYEFSGQEQDLRIWLPAGMRLDTLQLVPYSPPKVPAAAAAYQPKLVPPPSRPRLWVNAESLPQIRANLVKGENAPLWERVKEQAGKPFELKLKPNTEIGYDSALETAAVAKAFIYLMDGDTTRGREAVGLMRDYCAAVEFDNLLDVTREIGRAIYSGALVYDWCYDLLTPAERESIRRDLLRLADDMEIGWPPFLQAIVNGHGNEAQVNRDLLCMAIATYDEDPLPYRYCAYRILEELAPMRAFEYQSPRHNQGVSYGPYRFNWDLHAAWIFRRMSGQPVFNDNLGEVYAFWLYMRLPGNQVLRDGDGFSDGRPVNLGATPLLSYAYSNNPVIKGDFERQGGLPADPIMVLLLNDPALRAEKSLATLPLTLDFGPVLGSMIARTGWNLGGNLADVVVEMKGGGYHFGNHQHADAGSFQIYYRGLQAVDLGQYHFYGTPYDSNFCKRSVAHSQLLVVDPDEKLGVSSNDGGTRSVRTCPLTQEQAVKDPLFANGEVISASFGPSPQRPFFSFFSVDLKSAYSNKIEAYVRTFCFLNLDQQQTPGVLIILDAVTTAKPELKKYWQVNTLNLPERTADGVILRNSALGLAGKVSVRMLRPRADEREVEILSGAAAYSVSGQAFSPPFPDRPEANGHRVLFSPRTAQAQTIFLTVLPMAEETAPELPVALVESATVFALTLADRVLVLGKTGKLLEQSFQVEVPADRNYQLLLAGLAPGVWSLRREDGVAQFTARVEARKNTAFFVVPGGRYTVAPGALPGAPEFQATATLMPALAAPLANRVFLDGRMLTVAPTKAAGPGQLMPALAILKALGLNATPSAEGLRLQVGDRAAVFKVGADTFELNGLRFRLPCPVGPDGDEWFVPDSVLAALLNRDLVRDAAATNASLTPARYPCPAEILWVEATPDPDPLALRALLADIPGRQEYWAAEGRAVRVDLALTRPLPVKGVGIKWHQGATRQAKFALETSPDGVTWKRVFEGASSGTTADLETYAFELHTVRHVRLVGFGNSANAWNSIVHFRVLTAAPDQP